MLFILIKNKKELKSLKEKQNKKIIRNEYEFKEIKSPTLKEYFYKAKDIKERNKISNCYVRFILLLAFL